MNKKNSRMSKTDYYLGIAKETAKRSPCTRRRFGAIIVKNDTIVATGYNGTMPGALNCGIDIPCIKDVAKEPTTISYNYCPAIHAEENACLAVGKERAEGGILYLASVLGQGDLPCFRCRRTIRRVGIKKVFYIDRNGEVQEINTSDFIDMENKWMMDKLEESNPDWMEMMME